MNTDRQRYPNRHRSRDSIERKMDQWIETGRQLVDGVSGNRPGQRKVGKPIGDSLDDVGRWVGDKLDWFFEEEEDWKEPWQVEQQDLNVNLSNKKRPLQAISLRGTRAITPGSKEPSTSDEETTWPDESIFRINRWERQESQDSINPTKFAKDSFDSQSGSSSRRLPRSSRRRA
tara:strand:- start:1746 stop:2267 length:522 start_codon:yes stop_codon:yes gene_type:complete